MAAGSVKAFTDARYTYYRLTKDFGVLKAGTIFYHDPDDKVYGSIAQGCLKNCWTPDGMVQNSLCGGTVILHYNFAETDWFEKVEPTFNAVVNTLKPGNYSLKVNDDSSWQINGRGDMDKYDF